MPSLAARLLAFGIRTSIRRRDWGDERAVARRARRLFGVPPALRWLRMQGLALESVSDGAIRGEWIRPPSPKPGAILYLHGGGYVACSPSTHRPITAALARLTGISVFACDYRLAPEHRFPAALDDTYGAYQWLLRRGIRPDTMAIGGDSAGGGLTLSTLVRIRDAGLPVPAAAICFSPWTDMTGSGESARGNDGRCAMFRPENLAQFSSAYLNGVSPAHPEASPLFADLHGLPPLLLQVGSTELLLDDARRVHRKIGEAGGESRLEEYDDLFHCWQLLDGIVPEAHTALMQAAAFVRSHIAATDAARIR